MDLVGHPKTMGTTAQRGKRLLPASCRASDTARPTDRGRIHWCNAHRVGRRLRQRILRATPRGDRKQVRSLQTPMRRSDAHTGLGVRRVTQVNQGQHTAGVERLVVLTPAARGHLVDQLSRMDPWRAQPVTWVSIPTRGGRLRPLGIPTMLDRCRQAGDTLGQRARGAAGGSVGRWDHRQKESVVRALGT